MNSLVNNIEIVRHSNAVAAGTTDITPGSGIDTSDCESVVFIVPFGAITATAVTSIKVQQSSDDGATDAYTDITGASVTVADDDDNKCAVVEVTRPAERYVKLIVDRGTANAVVDGIIAIKHGLRKAPVTQGSTVVTPTVVAGV